MKQLKPFECVNFFGTNIFLPKNHLNGKINIWTIRFLFECNRKLLQTTKIYLILFELMDCSNSLFMFEPIYFCSNKVFLLNVIYIRSNWKHMFNGWFNIFIWTVYGTFEQWQISLNKILYIRMFVHDACLNKKLICLNIIDDSQPIVMDLIGCLNRI